MSLPDPDLPRLRRMSAGRYQTADGRWRVFIDDVYGTRRPAAWKLNASTRTDAEWLRRSGLLAGRFLTRSEALRSLTAMAVTAPDLPQVTVDPSPLLPLRACDGAWITNGDEIAVQPQGMKLRGRDPRRGWVVVARPAVQELFSDSGLGTRVFARRADALRAAAGVLDDPLLVARANQRIRGRCEVALRACVGRPEDEVRVRRRFAEIVLLRDR